MDGYRRLISYLYEYDGKIRLLNKGFVRVDIRNGCGRLFVRLDNTDKDGKVSQVMFYRWMGGIIETYELNTYDLINGSKDIKYCFRADNIAEEISFDDVCGILVELDNDKIYGADWDERPINTALIDKRRLKEENTNEIINNEAETKEENTPVMEKHDWREIFKSKNIIQPFFDDDIYDCVETNLEIINVAPFSKYKFNKNSFLMHSFYNYEHILIGKTLKAGRYEQYIVGVPGVYSNRERYMASMYGFNNFKKSNNTESKNRYFGYWYCRVED